MAKRITYRMKLVVEVADAFDDKAITDALAAFMQGYTTGLGRIAAGEGRTIRLGRGGKMDVKWDHNVRSPGLDTEKPRKKKRATRAGSTR